MASTAGSETNNPTKSGIPSLAQIAIAVTNLASRSPRKESRSMLASIFLTKL